MHRNLDPSACRPDGRDHATFEIEKHPGAWNHFRISFGIDPLDPTSCARLITIVTHPDYKPPVNPKDLSNTPRCNDVAVIILAESIYNVPPAKLPYAGLLSDLKAAGLLRGPGEGGTPFTVAGYGSTLDFPPPESIAGDGWRRFTETQYLALTKAWLFTLTNPATGNGGAGYGDSGGPNYWVARRMARSSLSQ